MDKHLLTMLVCPVCKGKLKYQKEQQELVCTFDGLAYPIRDEVPVMLDNEARRLPEDEKLALAKQAKQESAS